MAFTLMTQNYRGNYQLGAKLVKDFRPDSPASKHLSQAPERKDH